jgi:hypothetical protein
VFDFPHCWRSSQRREAKRAAWAVLLLEISPLLGVVVLFLLFLLFLLLLLEQFLSLGCARYVSPLGCGEGGIPLI